MAVGGYVNQIPSGLGTVPADVFVAEYLQMSADGNRVVYSTRTPAGVLVPGTTDTNISLDVFAHDVATDRNLVVAPGRPPDGRRRCRTVRLSDDAPFARSDRRAWISSRR
jgi:hypothetical protein